LFFIKELNKQVDGFVQMDSSIFVLSFSDYMYYSATCITRRQLAEAYDISTRTLSRWLRDVGFCSYKRYFTPTEKEYLLQAWGDPTIVKALQLLPGANTGTLRHEQLAVIYGISRHTFIKKCRQNSILLPQSYLKPKDILIVIAVFGVPLR
jgi:hypothetical protein